MSQDPQYSPRYNDGTYEYRHVILPPSMFERMPRGRLLTEAEWRNLGVQQSRGWVHYCIHKPEPHILLFRRPLGYDPATAAATAAQQQHHQLYSQYAL